MKDEIYLILDNIRSRENVGSIFRTADAAGVAKIYFCGITPTPEVGNPKFEILNPKPRTIAYGELRGRQIPNSKFSRFYRGSSTRSGQIQNQDKIAKTALGAEKWVPWEYRRDTWRIITELKSKDVEILALENTKGAENIFLLSGLLSGSTTKSVALVLGNEVKGLSPAILKKCDKKIAIPMYGRKESLNVAVAAGVALYTLRNLF